MEGAMADWSGSDWTGHDGATTLPKGRGFLARSLSEDFLTTGFSEAVDQTFDDALLHIEDPAPGARLYTPVGYVSSYRYPLIVWLNNHDDLNQTSPSEKFERGSCELARWLPLIDDRNHVGLALAPTLCSLPPNNDVEKPVCTVGRDLERFSSLLRVIADLRSIHPHRIYLAGQGAAAQRALQWIVRRPDRFAGMISIDGQFESPLALRGTPAGLSGKRLLFLNVDESGSDIAEPQALAALLHGQAETASQSEDDLPFHSAAHAINRWILSPIPGVIS